MVYLAMSTHVLSANEGQTERSMVRVCERTKTKAAMLEETIYQYKEMFIIARREFEKVVGVCNILFFFFCETRAYRI